ncbi:MAG: alpha/beta hydrolase-fold protein [Thermoplasmata archaeon]
MPVRLPPAPRSPSVFPRPLRGAIAWHTFPSACLRGNPLGDPSERELPVYLPPSGRTEGLPLVVLLSGYTGTGPLHFQRPRYLAESRAQQFDRLIVSGRMPEAVMVAPDARTTLGGSQYLNSAATGRYDDYVTKEVVPWVRERYRTGPVGVVGTSSGGFGALSLAMRHPEVFRAAASDSGDMYFDYCYLPEFPVAARTIRRAGGTDRLLRRIFGGPVDGLGPGSPESTALEMMAYASCYSPVPRDPGAFELPFDLETGALLPAVWRRWLAFDPVRMLAVARYREALRRCWYVYLDAGGSDEWFLDLGARIFAARSRALGIPVDWREFSGRHGDVARRYDAIFPGVVRALRRGGSDGPLRTDLPRGRPTRRRSRPPPTRGR